MLQKVFVSTVTEDMPSAVISVKTKEDLEQIKYSVLGLSLPSSLVLELKDFPYRYYSVLLEDFSHLAAVQKKLQKKQQFLELRVPKRFINKVLTERIEQVQRLIVIIEKEENLEDLNHIFAELIARNHFPLVEGAPLCRVPLRHTREFYHRFSVPPKNNECQGCLLQQRCPYQEGFAVKPITDLDLDAENFMKNENTFTRL